MSCDDRHARAKSSNEREFREQLDIIGMQQSPQRRLLLGNCKTCGTTLSLRLPS